MSFGGFFSRMLNASKTGLSRPDYSDVQARAQEREAQSKLSEGRGRLNNISWTKKP